MSLIISGGYYIPGGRVVECWTGDPEVPGSNTDHSKNSLQCKYLTTDICNPELNTWK